MDAVASRTRTALPYEAWSYVASSVMTFTGLSYFGGSARVCLVQGYDEFMFVFMYRMSSSLEVSPLSFGGVGVAGSIRSCLH